jgi:predicted glycosyl hydrolase (DUF1957 family)
MFDDIERVVECPGRACALVADIVQGYIDEPGGQSYDELTKQRRLVALMTYHTINVQLEDDYLSRVEASKALREHAQDFVEVFEKL